jgi:hypothetical protein
VARFTPKVLRLLSDELTGTVLREIDALFSDNDVPLGPPQPDENDPGERRERMRRYLASLNFDNSSQRLLRDMRAKQRAERLRAGSMWQRPRTC